MPLFRVPGRSLLRRRSSKDKGAKFKQDDGLEEVTVTDLDGPAGGHVLSSLGSAGSWGHSRPRASFRFTVPEGAKPGQCLRIQGPDGRHVNVTIPAGCRPGRQVWVQPQGSNQATIAGVCSNGAEALQDLEEAVRATADAARASRASLWQALEDELEIQRAIWSSASQAPTAAGFLQQFIGGALGGLAAGGPLACAGATYEDGLSQTQVVVFAAADAGDLKQLLAALAEARKFSVVSRSLEEATQNLTSVEEAIVTWQCLLDALRVRDCHEMEVWLEQARGLGLEIPPDVHVVLAELRRRKDLEQRLQFALEACDPELLAEVTAEAERLGLGDTALAREAAARMCMLASGRTARAASPSVRVGGAAAAARQTPPRPRQPMSQWEAALNGFFGMQAPGSPGLQQTPPPSAAQQQSPGAGPLGGRRQPSFSPPKIQVEDPEGGGGAGPQSLGPQDPSQDSPFGVRAGAGGSKAYQWWQDANAWRGEQPQGPPTAQSPPGAAPRSPEPQQPGQQEEWQEAPAEHLESLASRQLLQECRRLGLDTRGCTERDDLIRLLRQREQARPQPPGQGGSAAGSRPPRNPQLGSTAVPSSAARSASTSQMADAQMAGTVWERRTAPSVLLSKRSQALFLLGLSTCPGKRASLTELRAAYRRAAMESHPDKIQNHARQEEAKELFQKVKESFDYLCTPEGGHLS